MEYYLLYYISEPLFFIFISLLFIFIPRFKRSKNPIIVALKFVPIIVSVSIIIIGTISLLVMKVGRGFDLYYQSYFIFFMVMLVFPVLILILSYCLILKLAKPHTCKHLKLSLFLTFIVSHMCMGFNWFCFLILMVFYSSDIDWARSADMPPDYKNCSSIDGYFDYESATLRGFSYDSQDRIAFRSGKRIDLFANSHDFSIYKLPDDTIFLDGKYKKYIIDYIKELVYFVKENKKVLITHNSVYGYSIENEKIILLYENKDYAFELENASENIDVTSLIEKKEYIGDVYHAKYTPLKKYNALSK